jgi:hypothetical protein
MSLDQPLNIFSFPTYREADRPAHEYGIEDKLVGWKERQ